MSEAWNGFRVEEFLFEDKPARIIFPEEGKAIGRLALKTLYKDAFPNAVELDLLKKGFHLCFVTNEHRWGAETDLDRMARFVQFVTQKHGLQKRIVPIGMSAGGLLAILLAAKYPESISCLYLDAPVLNYLSCPGCLGDGRREDSAIVLEEVYRAIPAKNMSQLIAYRDAPLDKLPILLQYKIPVVLVAGLADRIVPYHENGQILQNAYEQASVDFQCHLKPGCDHHPHGVEDNEQVIQFIMTH